MPADRRPRNPSKTPAKTRTRPQKSKPKSPPTAGGLPAGGSRTPLGGLNGHANGSLNGSAAYAGFRDPILMHNLGKLVGNATSVRVADLAASAGDPRRSVEDECGYPPPDASIDDASPDTGVDPDAGTPPDASTPPETGADGAGETDSAADGELDAGSAGNDGGT